MSLTHLRAAVVTLLTTLVWAGAGCTLDATGTGLEDGTQSTLDDRDGALGPPTGLPARDAAVEPVRPVNDAGVPSLGAARDAGVPAADADVPVDDVQVPPAPRDAGGPRDASAPPDAGRAPDAGMSVEPVARCGTRGGIRCGARAFCNFEPDTTCGALDRGGVCEARPDVCTQIYSPVCGCDNVTYPSECHAHSRGVSVKRAGACGVEECQAAGGRVRGNGNGAAGCQSAAVQWEIVSGGHTTACCIPAPASEPPAGTAGTCGGIAGVSCPPAAFCNYERGAGGLGCGIADGTGVCEARAQVCTREFNPVCGCDGTTYPTACVAHAQGISVRHAGACE